MKIPVSLACRLALRGQGLDGGWGLPAGKEGVAQAIEHLGYVQIDTIAVVQRAHHHTLWARCPDYAPQMLHELQACDRRIFEYWWAGGASYIPMGDYRYYLPRMRASAESQRARHWLAENAPVAQEVLARIRQEGALASADFEAPEGFQRGTWWNWKPAKRALETLFSMGELMVRERRSFQRVYDLAERVLPSGADTTEPPPDEVARFMVRRMLAAHGVASPGELRKGVGDRDAVEGALGELQSAGEVLPVEIEGLDGEPYYALAATLTQAAAPPQGKAPLHILCPFDNLLTWRGRLEELFGFDYSLECYLPAAKRRYGYFCLPILWGERFVGRLDPKADRRQKTLIVRRIIFEPSLDDYERLLPALGEKLRAMAAFNGCERVLVERVMPEKVEALVQRSLDVPPFGDIPQGVV